MQRISINGIKADHLSVTDRAFQYGDGLFETIACRNGAVEFWDEHMARFSKGAERLAIPFPGEDKYWQDISQLPDSNTSEDAVIKLILTRGSAERGYKPSITSNPTRCVIVSHWPEFPDKVEKEGVATCLCKHPVSLNPKLAGIKHLNRLDNVMARKEWGDEYSEGFMTDGHRNIIEGTMSNVFCIKDNRLLTPRLEQAGVEGIAREQIILLAKGMGVETHINNITIDEFNIMDEIFISNSIIGLWPVKSVDKENYSIGSITRKLISALKQRTQEHVKTFI